MTEQKFVPQDFKEELRRQNLRWENEVSAIRKNVAGIKSNIRNQTIAIIFGTAVVIIDTLLK